MGSWQVWCPWHTNNLYHSVSPTCRYTREMLHPPTTPASSTHNPRLLHPPPEPHDIHLRHAHPNQPQMAASKVTMPSLLYLS